MITKEGVSRANFTSLIGNGWFYVADKRRKVSKGIKTVVFICKHDDFTCKVSGFSRGTAVVLLKIIQLVNPDLSVSMT